MCDYIEDRHGNRTNLTYTNVTLPGGVPKKLLASVTDPTGRQLHLCFNRRAPHDDGSQQRMRRRRWWLLR